ncbi:MAG: AAA family ATPase, partial [Chloroflexi bacterium]|nr:AAA family ATPase [Chloroflexota bacterium]
MAGTSALASREAERRQLTCLFCDLESSVALSARLDPEELREVIAQYQQVCATVIRRYEGYIARYFGDGILVYFGFPLAHEDEAQRAVRTALGILEAVEQLNARLERDRGIGLHARLGIHTGLVVAGDVGDGHALETMAAIGETPNIAARLQSLASPDSVVISAATFRLIAGYFNCLELGFRTLRGIAEPMPIYQVLNESGARTRLDIASQRGLPPMAGRTVELDSLIEGWRRAGHGDGSLVDIVGEPGIGKSRLIWALEEHVAQAPDASLVKLACSPYYQNTAFYPIVDFLSRIVLQFERDDTVEQRLDKIDGYLTQYGFSLPEVAPVVAELLGVPFEQRYQPLDVPAERRRHMIIDWLVRTVLVRAEQQPLLFVAEDLQWADASSLAVLSQLVEHLAGARLLLVVSFRPEFSPAWPSTSRASTIALRRLDPEASANVVRGVAGRALPSEILVELVARADGVPLYLEELTKLVLELDVLRQHERHFELVRPLPRHAIPSTLADSLTARLDRLPRAKGIAQLGATIGREFSYELIASVLREDQIVDDRALRQELDQLVNAELLLVDPSGRTPRYSFKHALIQDVAYESLLRSTRQEYHQRIARVLSDPSSSALEIAPELLAHHYTQAGLVAESVSWWLRAGQRALRASAYAEAIAHLTTGLEQLAKMPEDATRAAQELELRLTIGPALMASRGWAAPEVEACYDRARALCSELGDTPQLAPVLYGL